MGNQKEKMPDEYGGGNDPNETPLIKGKEKVQLEIMFFMNLFKF